MATHFARRGQDGEAVLTYNGVRVPVYMVNVEHRHEMGMTEARVELVVTGHGAELLYDALRANPTNGPVVAVIDPHCGQCKGSGRVEMAFPTSPNANVIPPPGHSIAMNYRREWVLCPNCMDHTRPALGNVGGQGSPPPWDSQGAAAITEDMLKKTIAKVEAGSAGHHIQRAVKDEIAAAIEMLRVARGAEPEVEVLESETVEPLGAREKVTKAPRARRVVRPKRS